MPLVDLRDASRECTCADSKLDTLPHRLDGRVCNGFTQAEVVDDDMHVIPNLSRPPQLCSLATVPRFRREAFGLSGGVAEEVAQDVVERLVEKLWVVARPPSASGEGHARGKVVVTV